MRRPLVVLLIVLGAATAFAVTGGLPFANAELPANFPAAPLAGATSTVAPAAAASIASPSPRPAIVASPSASPVPAAPLPEVVAVVGESDQKLTLINGVTGKTSGSVDLGIPAKNIAVEPDGRTALVFSSKPGESDYLVVDLWKGERKDSKRLHDNPSAAAFSSDGLRTYITLSGGLDSPPQPNTIVFLNTKDSNEFGHVEVGNQSPGVQILRRIEALAVAPGPAGDVLYAAGHLSGTVWALDGGSGKVLKEIEIGGGPLAVLTDASRRRVYVLTDTTNELIALDTATQAVVSRLALSGRPSAGAIARNGTIYFTSAESGELWPIAPDMAQIGEPVLVGNQPSAVGVSLDGARVYVATRADSSLAVIDPNLKRVSSRIKVGKDPVAVAVTAGRPPANSTPLPTSVPAAHPTATPTIVPTATPLPEGVLPPEHMPSAAVNDAFVSDAAFPVGFAFAPDGTLFYNELHTGNIRVVKNGTLLPDPFYNFKVSGQPEAGLISVTLDPDFANNHYVYVFYTSVPDGQDNGGPNGPNEVVRLTDVADKGTNLTYILKDLPSGPIHNSGNLRFGPDGKLYVSLGDNDQGNNAQDLGTLAGKILRVNPDGSIPSDNPFVGQPGKQPAIWAYGIRNMFSFDFDPVSHGLLATENGPGDNDELDVVTKGANFGWPPSGYKYRPGVVDPIGVMNPPIGPTGMTFYTGDQIPEWKNDWFYCNFHQGQLRRVRLAPESRDRVVFEEIVKNGCLLDVVTGPDGALYYSNPKGIYRIHSADATNLLAAVTATSASSTTPASSTAPATSATSALSAASASSAATPAPAVTPQPTAEPTEVLPAGTRAEDRDIGITLNEWKMQPSRTKVPTGQLRFLSENTGNTAHALRIVGKGIDVSTDNFGPGESRTINVVLPPGQYRLVCPIPGHEAQGMAATLTVVGN